MSDKFPIDVGLVKRLVAGQFPQWVGLEVRPVASSGWDNFTFHLGETMKVRLPSAAGYAEQTDKELPEGQLPGMPVWRDPLLNPGPTPAERETPPLD